MSKIMRTILLNEERGKQLLNEQQEFQNNIQDTFQPELVTDNIAMAHTLKTNQFIETPDYVEWLESETNKEVEL